jgi:hypothetical protein
VVSKVLRLDSKDERRIWQTSTHQLQS